MSILGGYRQLQRRSWEASMSRVEGKYPRHGRLLLVVSLDQGEKTSHHVRVRTVWVEVGNIAIGLLALQLGRS